MNGSKNIHLPMLGALVGILAFLRFYHLSSMGIFDDDAAVYVTLAHNWLDGIINIGANKMGYHLLCFLAAKLIGMYDDTILLLNSAMDLIGVVLLYVLAMRLRVHAWLALSAVAVYGCLPVILYENTRGLPHLPSMVFVVGSLIAFFSYLDGRSSRPGWIFVCGLTAAFAGMTHPTAMASYLLYPPLMVWASGRNLLSNEGRLRLVTDLLLYAAAGILIVASIVGILTISSHDFVQSFLSLVKGLSFHHSIGTQGESGSFADRIFALKKIAPQLFPAPYLAGFVTLTIAAFLFKNRTLPADAQNGRPAGPRVALLAVFVSGFVLLNAAVDKAIQGRLLIPVLPLAALVFFALPPLTGLCRRIRWMGPLVLSCSVALAGYEAAAHAEDVIKPKTIFRQMGDELAGRIGPEARVLFLPSQFRKCMMEALYLDARWLYRLRQPWVPNLQELALYRIRYIMIASDLYGDPDKPPTADETRQMQLETNLMVDWLKTQQTSLLYRGKDLYIFEVHYPPLPAIPSPILTPRTHPFYNSLQADYIGPRFYRLTRARAWTKSDPSDQNPAPPPSSPAPGV